MNPEQILQSVGDQLLKTAEKSAGKIHVLFVNGTFEVVTTNVFTKPVKPIASYRADDIRKGLTVDQWRSLSIKIAKAMKEKP